ncbi:CRS2-associated factor 1, mitochondrial isoform X2 [Dendrobium catenatum]|uniref:CRS2-associated factor 1, mitochondrial isoform X2 n=1 Tax=Dendrobium catenatum TaxID=906689 RepID=UPI0009F4192A|nr:CRS2-associated factor 1, mitochondrial isoform X2 [Dendrobium catenatum]
MIFRQITSKKYFFSVRFFSSILKDRYGFVASSIPIPQSCSPNSSEVNGNQKRKKNKEPYRPPSSLDMTGKKIIHSNLPFDFRFSYTESNPNVKPIGLREPKYSPFGPGRVDRAWTGVCAPAVDPVLKSVEGDVSNDAEKKLEEWRRRRKMIIGEILTPAERAFLIEKCQKNRTKRQVNLGRDGLTHNMLNDIHNNWKHSEAVRIKCLGVPTVDMKNVCNQLETGGLIIHRHGGQIILFRGRHYNPKKRPVIPLMLWKPHEPVYPRLIRTVIDGLTIEETKETRRRGLAVPALTKLAKNGYYASLVPMVRDAFLTDELVRIDCKGLPTTDYKKIGVKLRELVPCILVTFQKEQVVVWRGKDYNSNAHIKSEHKSFSLVSKSDESTEKTLTDISAPYYSSYSHDQSSDTEDFEMDPRIEEQVNSPQCSSEECP